MLQYYSANVLSLYFKDIRVDQSVQLEPTQRPFSIEGMRNYKAGRSKLVAFSNVSNFQI